MLRLLETFDLSDLRVAVTTALRMGTVGFDAIKHLLLCQVEKRPPKLDLDVYPYLPRANVGTLRQPATCASWPGAGHERRSGVAGSTIISRR